MPPPKGTPKQIEAEPSDSQRKKNVPDTANSFFDAVPTIDEALLPNDRDVHDCQKLLGFSDIFQEMNDMAIKLNSLQMTDRVKSADTNV